MSKKRKRKEHQQSSQSSGSATQTVSTKQTLMTHRFHRKINRCRSSLYDYSHMSDIIRWNEGMSGACGLLAGDWRDLQSSVKKAIRSGIFEGGSLMSADPDDVFIAMVALFLTNHIELALKCRDYFILPVEDSSLQLNWAGEDRLVVALIISLISAGELFELEDFTFPPSDELEEEIKTLWRFEDGIDSWARYKFGTSYDTNHPKDLRRLCLAVMDKYEIDDISKIPDDTLGKPRFVVYEITQEGRRVRC